ncbi:MAG: hypothetical protein FJ390_00015 [Verrucomicrobia bacterium]|nr:hypothetical protein [Verrucomicrobiota bacterium]
MDQISSDIPTAQATPISATEAVRLPSAEATAVFAVEDAVPSDLRLQPGKFVTNSLPPANSSAGMSVEELRARRVQYYEGTAASSDDRVPVAQPLESGPIAVGTPFTQNDVWRADDAAAWAGRSRVVRRMVGDNGSTQVSVTRLNLAERAQLIGAINVVRARMSHSLLMASIRVVQTRMTEDREPGAIKRAVKDVTGDPQFEQKLQEANVKGLKAYALFVASMQEHEAKAAESIETPLPQQQQQGMQPTVNVSSAQQGTGVTSVNDDTFSLNETADQKKAIEKEQQEHAKETEAQLKGNAKIDQKSEELKKGQQEKKISERDQELSNIARVDNPLIMP